MNRLQGNRHFAPMATKVQHEYDTGMIRCSAQSCERADGRRLNQRSRGQHTQPENRGDWRCGGLLLSGASVVVTLLISILLAYFLDPAVSVMERIRLPRALGSLLMVLVTLSILGSMCWILVERADAFGRDWPHYRAPLNRVVRSIDSHLNSFEAQVDQIGPGEPKSRRQVYEVAPPEHPVRKLLFERLQSIYPLIMSATFIPFLVFFMLAAKRHVWYATIRLFPIQQRMEVELALNELSLMLRGYVIGILTVCAVMVAATGAFLWYMGFNFPFLTGLISGILNIIPYIGVVLFVDSPVHHRVGAILHSGNFHRDGGGAHGVAHG